MVRRFKMQLLVWLTMTETGEFSEIGQLYRHLHFVFEICHDGQLSKRSLFYQEDFWRLGQEKVKTSRVILTNHAYLLRLGIPVPLLKMYFKDTYFLPT